MKSKRKEDEDNTKNGKIKEEEILKILDLMFINMRVSVLLFLNFHFSLNHFISFRMMFFHGKPLHERFFCPISLFFSFVFAENTVTSCESESGSGFAPKVCLSCAEGGQRRDRIELKCLQMLGTEG